MSSNPPRRRTELTKLDAIRSATKSRISYRKFFTLPVHFGKDVTVTPPFHAGNFRAGGDTRGQQTGPARPPGPTTGLLAVVALTLIAFIGPIQAAEVVVTNTDDSRPGPLRQAIADAEAARL